MKSFGQRLDRVQRVAGVLALAPVAARWTGICLAAVSGILFVSAWVSFRGGKSVMAGVCAASVFAMVRAMKSAASAARWEHVARKWGVCPDDVFRTAQQLAKAETKTVFHERALQQVHALVPRGWIRRLWEKRWTWDYALLIGSVALFWGLIQFDGFVPRLSLDVVPGNATFARGSDVSIEVRRTNADVRPLSLEIKGKGGRWEPRVLGLDPDGRHRALLRSLRDPLIYRVRSGFERTPSFQLVPFDPPQLMGLVVHVTSPSYMGKKPETFQDVLSLHVWAGSRIRWRFQLNFEDIVPRIEGGPELKKTDGGWVWEETVEHSLRRAIWAVRPRETEVQVAEVAVEVEADKPPSAVLLGPTEDVQADLQDVLPISAEFNDDVGLGSLDFFWRTNEGPWRRQSWGDFPLGTLDKGIERPWDLAPMLFQHGDKVDFYLEVRDRCVPAGRGRTETRRVSVSDVRQEQEKLQDELEQVHRSLRDRVLEQRLILEDLRRATPPNAVAVSTPNWAALIAQQRQFARRLAQDEERLENVLNEMESSESVETDTLMEHHALAEGLNDLQKFDLPQVDRSLGAQDRARSDSSMEQVADRLESMQKRADESLRDQWARGWLRGRDDLENRTEALAQVLSNLGALSEEERERFMKTAEALESAVQRIRRQLEQWTARSDLRDGPGREETLRFDRVAKALENMAEALGRSDGAGALSAANDALKELEEIERQLARGSAEANSTNAEEEEILASARWTLEKIRRLADRQEALHENTMLVVDSMEKTLNPNETSFMASLSSQTIDQNALSKETHSVSESLRSPALKAGFYSPRISRMLDDAAGAMDQAADRLSMAQPKPAGEFQLSALERLRESETQTNEFLHKRSSSSLGRGRNKTGRRFIRLNGTDGTQPIPLPKTEEFRSPGTFRRDLIEGMKEPVPVDQQPAVQDYYRHWTK